MGDTVKSLIGTAYLAGLLGRGFAYPNREFQESIGSGVFFKEILEVIHYAGSAALADEFSKTTQEVASVGPESLEGEYTYLFERKVRCPLNESSYEAHRGIGTVHDLAEVASFYDAFGFQIASGVHQLADHLSIQLEFLGVLYAKEAYAYERGWQDRAGICSDARTKFASWHMQNWMERLAKLTRKHGRMAFYPVLAEMALGVVDRAAGSAVTTMQRVDE